MSAPAPAAADWKLPAGIRLLCFHKQRTSARLRFLLFADGLIAPAALAADATLAPAPGALETVVVHPAVLAAASESRLGLARGDVRIDPEFRIRGQERAEAFTLLLAEFTAIDPPFEAAAAVGGRFVAITEARGLALSEREVLRLAYAHVLG
jgi:hypothetical protein